MGGLGAIETGLTLYYHFTFVRRACTTSCCLHFIVYTFMSDVFGGWVDL